MKVMTPNLLCRRTLCARDKKRALSSPCAGSSGNYHSALFGAVVPSCTGPSLLRRLTGVTHGHWDWTLLRWEQHRLSPFSSEVEETSFKSEDRVLLHLPPPLWSSRSGWLGASPPEVFDLNSWFLGVCGSCPGADERAEGKQNTQTYLSFETYPCRVCCEQS